MTRTLEQLELLVQNIAERAVYDREKVAELTDRIQGLESLEETDSSLRDRIRDLEVLLNGDQPLRAEWAKHKALGVTPNIPEPPIGVIPAFEESFRRTHTNAEIVRAEVTGKLLQLEKFVFKLEQFFGPMLRDKNPPLDGEQIASKAYVDTGLARLAGALRDEFVDAVAFTRAVVREFPLSNEEMGRLGVDVSFGTRVAIIADKLRLAYAWVMKLVADQEAAARRPSRLQILKLVLTGKMPDLGDRS